MAGTTLHWLAWPRAVPAAAGKAPVCSGASGTVGRTEVAAAHALSWTSGGWACLPLLSLAGVGGLQGVRGSALRLLSEQGSEGKSSYRCRAGPVAVFCSCLLVLSRPTNRFQL